MSKWTETTERLKEEHLDFLSTIPDAYFTIKTPVRFKDQSCVVLYKTELSKGDVYLELVDTTLNPSFDRTLYRYVFNKFWDSEYESVQGEPDKYYIPLEELHTIPKKTDVAPKGKIRVYVPKTTIPVIPSVPAGAKVDDVKSFLDAPMSSLTIRDYVAIIHRRPISKNKDLNDLLKQI